MSEINPWADSPEEREAVVTKSDRVDLVNLKLEEGENTIRIVGKYTFFYEHWFNKVKRSAVCPGKDCPVCKHPDRQKFLDQASALRKAGQEKEAKELFRKTFRTYDPRVMYAVNVIDRRDGKMKVWKFSRTVKEDIMKIADKYGDPNGYDLTINRRGKGRDTEYTLIPARENTPLTEAERQLKVVSLGTVYKATSLEKINSYLQGVVPTKQQRSAPATQTVESEEPEALEEPELNMEELDNLGGF